MDEDKFRNRLAGGSRFAEDLKARKMVYALIVRAEKAPGKLIRISPPELPERIGFFSAGHIPGKNLLPFPDESMPLLAEDEILYEGQPVAVITGPDINELYKLRRKINIETSPIPAFPPFQMRDRNASPASALISKGNIARGFDRADQIVKGEFRLTPPELPVYPGSDVLCTKEGGTYHLHIHTQWPSLLRRNCALAAGISRKQVELHFNSAGRSWDSHVGRGIPEAALAVCVTSILRQPVKLIGEHEKVFRKEILLRYKAGMDTNGRLTALQGELFLNTGAYGAFAAETVSRLCLGAAGVYQCRNLELRGKGYRSNTPPWLPLASWGLAQGTFGMEMLANRLAVEAGQDPAGWRILNLPVKGGINTTMAPLKQTPPLADMIEKTASIADYTRKHAVSRQIRTNKTVLEIAPSGYSGIGLAVTRQGYEFLSRDRLYTAASVSATLHKEGHIEIILGTVPATPGILAVWKKNISSRLGLEEDKIILIQDRPDEQSFNGPSCLSRNIQVFTRLIEQCCDTIQKKRFREALPITETRSYRRRTSAEWDETKMTGKPFSSPSWGCAVVEASLFTATGEITVPRIWLSLCCGPLMDPAAARSFVEAEVRLALSQCMDKQAIIPSIFPELHIDFFDDGSKATGGLEGLVLGTVPAAFNQALSQACGRSIGSLPVNSAALLTGGT